MIYIYPNFFDYHFLLGVAGHSSFQPVQSNAAPGFKQPIVARVCVENKKVQKTNLVNINVFLSNQGRLAYPTISKSDTKSGYKALNIFQK